MVNRTNVVVHRVSCVCAAEYHASVQRNEYNYYSLYIIIIMHYIIIYLHSGGPPRRALVVGTEFFLFCEF